MPNRIRFTIIHPDLDACQEVSGRFRESDPVDVVQGRLDSVVERFDAIVTAGNSYGMMSAGFDAAVLAFAKSEELETTVRDKIQNDFLGEQPIGTAFIVPSQSEAFRFLVHAPTMRTPGPIDRTDKVYVSTWASLIEMYRHNRDAEGDEIRTALFPLMGAGFGQVSPSESARQMCAAIRNFQTPQRVTRWETVTSRESKITMDDGVKVVRD